MWKWFAGTGIGAGLIAIAAWLVSLGRQKEAARRVLEHTTNIREERLKIKRVRNEIEVTLKNISTVSDYDKRLELYREWIRAGLESSRKSRLRIGD